jgi:hypothetical protein
MSLLHVTDGYNGHKYYIDGRRCTKDRYNQIWAEALNKDKLSSMFTQRKNGAWYHYTSA